MDVQPHLRSAPAPQSDLRARRSLLPAILQKVPATRAGAIGIGVAAGAAALAAKMLGSRRGGSKPNDRALRLLHSGAAVLATSVLADSTMEHHRARFYNRFMYLAPAVSGLALLAALDGVLQPRRRAHLRNVAYGAAAATGLVGTGFHLYNQLRKEGGWSWNNLFYSAPIAAPMGIHLAGLFGLSASRIAHEGRLPGDLGAPVLGTLAAVGLLGSAGEAGLLHFRGAFQDPFMYLPVTFPPAAAAALVLTLATRDPRITPWARVLLKATVAIGLAGSGFHAWGVHRNMGGWRNWRQNLLAGPPLPAPPSFTGLALGGLATLHLQEERRHVRLQARLPRL
jgi:hypothetical protein